MCGDYVYCNSQCVPLQANAPDVPSQINRAAGGAAFWYTDGHSQYNGWTLHPDSRDVLALWTPIGLIRPTVMQFGWLNSGVIAQGAVRVMMAKDLSSYSQDHSLNYMDDFTGYCDFINSKDGQTVTDWEGLLQSFKEMVELADKNNMSLKPSKTCFGTREVEFYGRVINKEGVRHAEHNLAPIERMCPPTDISELRRVLGLCVQHKDAIKDFAFLARPLHDLTRKGTA